MSSDLVEEIKMAPKAPWTARAKMSIIPSTDAPPIADAQAKPATPMNSVLRAPRRSASRPPGRRNPAMATV